MNIGFLLNRELDLKPSQTTSMLIARAAAKGHRVIVFGVGDVAWRESGPAVTGRWVPPIGPGPGAVARTLRALSASPRQSAPLADVSAVMVRTSPGRDTGRLDVHRTALTILRLAEADGCVVVNRPDGLVRAASKLYLSHLPAAVRPETLVSHDPHEIRAFVLGRSAPTVLKPLLGTRGQDVFLVRPGQTGNLNQIIDVLTRSGHAMAQAFVPEATAGDTRVLLLDGEPLMIDGHVAAVRRVPGAGDFRSNVHVGATPTPAVMSPTIARVAAAIGPHLRRDGLFLVGMDLIGDRIVELNVYSTGGLSDAEQNTGADFTGRVIDALVERVQRAAR